MNLDSLRSYCLSLPHAAEKIQWEDHLLFTIGGKMFVLTSFEPGPYVVTLKPDPEHRLELLEVEGIEPAPYLARAGWLSIRGWDVLRDAEWRDLVSESYRMVVEKLPKKLRDRVAGGKSSAETTDSRPKKRSAKKAAGAKSATKKTAAPRKRAAKASSR